MSISAFARRSSGSLLRSLWNRDLAATRRRSRRSFAPAIDQLESRVALAITSPLQIGGTTVGSFYDAPTGPGNLGDLVTVSITGTSGKVIFNGGTGVADGTDIQTIEILNASPDFQLTFGATITRTTAVPYGSDGVVNLGVITTQNVIRGINTVRGPATNVASPWEIGTSATHLYTFNDGTVSDKTVTDLIGGADGTLVNGATVADGSLVLADLGKIGPEVQYMQMPTDVILQGSTAVTAELWFTASANSPVWGRGFDIGSGDQSYLFFAPRSDAESPAGGSRAAISQGSSEGEVRVDGTPAYNDDEQRLATVTVDDASDTLIYYIDGVEIGRASLGDTTLSAIEATRNFLGRSQFDLFDGGFIGSMNQFALYDRALTPEEILANFTAGPIAGPLTPIGFTQATPGSGTLQLVGDQTTAFPVDAFVCATPLLPEPAGTPTFAKVDSVSYDADTNVTTITLADGATTATGTTAGALTLAKTVSPEFRLTTFVGRAFSTAGPAEAGGLFVDVVQGGDYEYDGDTIDNLGILLTDGLPAYATIGIRRQLAATVLLGTSNGAAVDGRFEVEAATPESAIYVGPKTANINQNSVFQLWGGNGEFGADVIVEQAFNGVVDLAGPATGFFGFARGVGPRAVLNAADWNGVSVLGNFAGRINATSSDLNLLIEQGNVLATARINADDDVNLFVGGSVLKGAAISAGSRATLEITRNLSGSVLSGSDGVTGIVGGDISGASITSEDEIDLEVGGRIVDSALAADNFLDLNVIKSVINSRFHVSEDDGMSVTVGGNVTKSTFSAGSNDDEGEDDSLVLTVRGSLSGTTVRGEENVVLTVTRDVTNVRALSTERDVSLNTQGSLRNSRIEAGDDIDLTVTRDARGVTAIADGTVSLDVGGNWSGVAQAADSNMFVEVDRSVLKGSSFITADGAVIDVGGNFDGTVAAQDLRFFVDGNVAKASRVVAESVSDWDDFGGPNFRIGGRLDGIVTVVDFDASGVDLLPVSIGPLDPAPEFEILGKGSGASARFNVGSYAAGDTLVFNGNFNGNMRVLQDLTSNLTFNGNVNRLIFGGRIGSFVPGTTVTPVNVAIDVAGRLNFLNSNSYFEATTPGKAGSFWNDSAKATPATGTLTTGSYVRVVPTLQTPPTLPPPTPNEYFAPTAPRNFDAKSAAAPTLGILVSFDAPSSDGGLPVLYYEYSTNADNPDPLAVKWRKFDTASQGPGTDIPLTKDSAGVNLNYDTTYQVAVRAVNAVGSTATTPPKAVLTVPPPEPE